MIIHGDRVLLLYQLTYWMWLGNLWTWWCNHPNHILRLHVRLESVSHDSSLHTLPSDVKNIIGIRRSNKFQRVKDLPLVILVHTCHKALFMCYYCSHHKFWDDLEFWKDSNWPTILFHCTNITRTLTIRIVYEYILRSTIVYISRALYCGCHCCTYAHLKHIIVLSQRFKMGPGFSPAPVGMS